MNLRPLADDLLLARLEALVSQERENVADIVEHLAEVDRREIVVDRGYTALFDYCRKRLHYSEAQSFMRIRAARASNEFPRILADLKIGTIHLDAVARLYPHLTGENSDRLLDEAAGASKREVLAMVARLGGDGSVVERDVIQRLPSRLVPLRLPPQTEPESLVLAPVQMDDLFLPPAASSLSEESVSAKPASHAAALAGCPAPKAASFGGSEVIAPPSRIRLAFTADDGFLMMVERLRSLRRHKFPAGRLEDLLKEAVESLLNQIDPDRRASRSGERRKKGAERGASKTRKRSRRIPAAVKSEVWRRDGGRCAYVAEEGRRCEGVDFLEYDHVVPWALGGRSDTADNVRLLCRPHNQRLARRRFGPRRK